MAHLTESATFELKQTRTGSIPFRALKPHQEQALLHVTSGRFVWKIMDCGYENPFDSFFLYKAAAYVVVVYSSKRFYCIDIDSWKKERLQSVRKSLTEERALCISRLHDVYQ